MNLEINPYISVHFLRSVDTIPLPDSHSKEHELRPKLTAFFQDWAKKNNIEDICDASQLSGELFDSLVQAGQIIQEEHAFGVKYYRFANNRYQKYRDKILAGNRISQSADSVGGRYFSDIYDAYRDQVSSFGTDITIPASDRMVSLDHNAPEYREIAEGISGLEEQVRGCNEISPEERDYLKAGLAAAKILWDSQQLRVIQVKVGVLMAVQDAVNTLEKLGKAVALKFLIDAIKSFVRNHVGIDLENI